MSAAKHLTETGCMKRNLGPFHSHWCALLEFHLKRKRLTGQAFALLIGKSQQVVHTYQTGKSRPPLDLVREWAERLGMTPHERDQFVTAAYEAWTPAPVWAKLVELEARALGAASHVRENGAVGELRKAVDDMMGVMRDVESLFYARNVPGGVEALRSKREEIGQAIRRLIERHMRPPPRPPPTTAG
jgi:transcriptional regulator with XRE-family HTH domain